MSELYEREDVSKFLGALQKRAIEVEPRFRKNVEKFLETLRKREEEYEKGLNHVTDIPVYLVISKLENYVSGHSDYSLKTNLAGDEPVHGMMGVPNSTEDELSEEDFFPMDELPPNGFDSAEEVTMFYTDFIVGVCLTYEAAKSLLRRQSHNINKGYIYTARAGYVNYEMEELLGIEKNH